MKYPLFLTRPAMVSSLGEGIETHLDVLLNGGESPLHLSDMPFKLFDLNGKKSFLGEVSVNLRPFPDDLPPEHRRAFREKKGCRSNGNFNHRSG